MRKLRVGVLFGGRSGEHEVSLASATAVLAALDRHKFEAVPIGITRTGAWLAVESPAQLSALQSRAFLASDAEEQVLPGVPSELMRVSTATSATSGDGIDVVIPVLHGPYGEDGTVQGLLETLNIPYVGSGVLGSALSMDKAAMKAQLAHAGLESVPWVLTTSARWHANRAAVLHHLESELVYPVFVKPCNMGSSVGISKASDRHDLQAALERAFGYDRRVIIEQGIEAREVECAVAGNEDPLVSVPGEIVSHREFYDYDAKYVEGLADLIIPARIAPEQTREVQRLAREAFLALDCAGLARVDFFVERRDGRVLVNEVNTMPGFTSTSMYPKLWEASGVSYPELLDRLIQYAFDRHRGRQHRSTSR